MDLLFSFIPEKEEINPIVCQIFLNRIYYPLKSSYVGKLLSQAYYSSMEDLRYVYYKLLDVEKLEKEETCNLLTRHIMEYYFFIKVHTSISINTAEIQFLNHLNPSLDSRRTLGSCVDHLRVNYPNFNENISRR